MKTIFYVLMAAAVVFYAACVPALAAPIAQSIPEANRIRSIEEAQAINKAESAEDMIEENGETAFDLFKADPERWLGAMDGIYVIDANEGSADEGNFIVYPPKEPSGRGVPDLSRARGKKLVREARESEKSGDETVWLGFVEGDPDVSAQATAIAVAPSGKKYAVIIWVHTEKP